MGRELKAPSRGMISVTTFFYDLCVLCCDFDCSFLRPLKIYLKLIFLKSHFGWCDYCDCVGTR